ncbi:transferrin-binding protein-like solute binding protein [Basilea psittacipulmonis]|uniref:Transferrin-binding protein B C-lobe/N-lobe beta-barrel domain-containing protein n=1 Tax=Basilea psittacipulmonis DSM 24701 TaxID=1072685 RepID=A0A077DDC6_9BURK|nr:transferrin-binding protein-like solute binding protein [Basilea psittacipulmonis]AIL32166.1 hypothetical protein IX83_01470 [Basilea psittacipulmonis DSM 24701]
MFQKYTITYLITAILLTACSTSGGTFDPLDVGSSTKSGLPDSANNVKYVNPVIETDPEAQSIDETGYSINVPIPKALYENYAKRYFNPNTLKINKDHNYLDTSDQYETLTLKIVSLNENGTPIISERKIPFKITEDTWNYLDNTIKESDENNINTYHDRTYNPYLKIYKLNNSLVGTIIFTNLKDSSLNINNVAEENKSVQLFYKGHIKPTVENMPISGTFGYNGKWFFVTQVNNLSQDTDAEWGKYSSSLPLSLTIDFTQKTVKGNLSHSGDNVTINYTIDAVIKGNYFKGVAKGKYESTGNSLNGSSEADADLIGSFFGDTAEEAAGRVIARDFSWGAVFATKRQRNDLSDLAAAGILGFDHNGTLQDYQANIATQTLDRLIVDGEIIDFSQEYNELCCAETKFVKYGTFKPENSNNIQGGYFIQGTATTDMPETGNASYRGNWYGFVKDSSTGYSATAQKNEATYQANWGDKTLSGKLFGKNQDINSDQPIGILSAKIQDNTFQGKVTFKDWAVDENKDNLENTQKISGEAEAKGYFYGAKANELGGHFKNQDNSAGGVFGGKQIEVTP